MFNISDPTNPPFVRSLDLGLTSNIASHEVMTMNGRMYVVSKDNNNDFDHGWTHIYDVSNVGTTSPVLLKAFKTGGRMHTSMPSEDGNTLVVSGTPQWRGSNL